MDSNKSPSDQTIQDEIRRIKDSDNLNAFKQANSGILKGASPINPHDAAMLFINAFLGKNLKDPEDCIQETLNSCVKENILIVSENLQQPLKALLTIVKNILAVPDNLSEFVRKLDFAWGQKYGEGPYFESKTLPQSSHSAHPKDPYTNAGIRDLLLELEAKIEQDLGLRN